MKIKKKGNSQMAPTDNWYVHLQTWLHLVAESQNDYLKSIPVIWQNNLNICLIQSNSKLFRFRLSQGPMCPYILLWYRIVWIIDRSPVFDHYFSSKDLFRPLAGNQSVRPNNVKYSLSRITESGYNDMLVSSVNFREHYRKKGRISSYKKSGHLSKQLWFAAKFLWCHSSYVSVCLNMKLGSRYMARKFSGTLFVMSVFLDKPLIIRSAQLQICYDLKCSF